MAHTIGARRAAAALIATFLVAAAVAAPTAVFAAATAPDAGGSLDLQTWPDTGRLVIVTAVTVPESVKLPATVRVPVPEGATVAWAGEVLGGDLSADPARVYKIIKSPVGGQYAEFTLEQTRSAQVDADMSALKVNGDITSASFEWVQSVASPFTSFSVRVPANASNPKVSPVPSAAPETNAAGERLYSGDPISLKPGQKQTVSFSFSTGVASPVAAAGGVGPLVFALSAALVVAVLVLVVMLVRQRRRVDPEERGRGAAPGPATSAMSSSQESQSGSAKDDDWGFDDEG